MKKMLCSLLVLSMMTAAAPIQAAGSESAKTPAESKPITAAIQKAGSDLAAQPLASAQKVPTNLPRTGSERVRKQGGGKTGLVIGLVSSLVGVAATVYMVKEMKKNNDGNN